jgi:hypothetical protein
MITAALLLAMPQAHLRDDALLNELQLRAVRFFWNESHPVTGFTKDRAANFANGDKFDVASCASTGFALAAYPIGVERRWLQRTPALERTRRTLRSLLTNHDQMNGWFAHFVNWETGKRVWNCEYSTIDTSILLGGVIAAAQYWKDPQVTRDADAILKRVDWKWALTDGGTKPEQIFFSHGYRPEHPGGWLPSRWDNYSEEKVLYLPAYGADRAITNVGWDRMKREDANYKGIDIIRGGPLFIHQMAESFYDFSNMRDRLGYNYYVASKNAAVANRQYCIDNPKGMKDYGPDFWGLSACDSPDGYSAFGAPHWIEDNGTITPTSAIASVYWLPKEGRSVANNLRANHANAWGRYGFSNGINPQRNWVGPDVIGIDLGMMLLNVENHRTGLIHRLTKAHPIIKRGYDRMGLRKADGSDKGPLKI